MRIPGFGSRQAKFRMGDHGESSSQAYYWYAWAYAGIIAVMSEFSLSYISKFSWVVHISAVVVVGINASVDDAHHYNSILKAS